MDVILLMTRVAICCQRDLGDILGSMAGMAIEAPVRPRERVVRLRVMIKAPSRPTIRVVAEHAIGSQAPLVMLVGVTGGARQRRVLEPG
jgi:hypothetical protein